jgi:peptidoglycan/xylan/chitin deacetylase (PgdA/CDA1 family)
MTPHEPHPAAGSSADSESLSLSKTLLLHSYYHLSLPWRWWRARRYRIEHRCPVIVLFYHRIADDGANSWTASHRDFQRQIDWLRRRFDLVSLEEAQGRIRSRDNRRPAVSITFDDGYSENCRHAIPLLVKWRIPCTYFVTLDNLLSGEPFAHDAVRGDRFPPNNLEQLKAMQAAGIEIGAHTRSHPDLGRISDEARLRDEVAAPREELQRLLDRRVRYFAFPFGQYANLNVRAFHIAREAGYEAVCSAYGGYNFPGDDAFHLQRIHVDAGLIRLKNRATVDPRKVNVPRFEYGEAEQQVVVGSG